MSDKPKANVITPEHIVAYPNLEKARAFEKNGVAQGKPKYGYTALFDKADAEAMKPLYAAAAAVAKAKWPDIEGAELQTILKRTFKDGDKEALRKMKRGKNPKSEAQVAYLKGKIVVNPSSAEAYPIDVSEPAAGGKYNPIIDWRKIYSGIKAKAELNFVAYDNSFGDAEEGAPRGFVSVYCNFLLKTGDGQRIGGRDRSSVWAGVQGSQSTADPTAGEDDIPF